MLLKITVFTVTMLLVTATQPVRADTTISLHDAVRQGKVKVEVKSLGRAAGPSVRVEVRSLVSEKLTVEVTPGTVLINAVNAEQNMVVGQMKGEFTRGNMYKPGNVMVLVDGKNRSFLLDAFCLDYAKDAPSLEGKLQLALQDKRVARILNSPAGLKPTTGAVQIAIWMDRAGITADQARKRFKGTTTDVDVQVARKLLVHAEKTGVESIPQDMPASVKVHVTKLFSSDRAIRRRAAEVIGQLGAEAESAVTILGENVLDRSTDKPLPANVVVVDVDAALQTAADTLERLGLPALEPLIGSLRDGTTGPAAKSVTGKAKGLVGEIVLEGLIARLKSRRATARVRAARLLGGSGSMVAIEPLIGALEDDDEQVRKAAAEALKTLTEQDFGDDVKRWRAWLKDAEIDT